jgi:molybdenum cofactor cytidylyltransferase
MTAQPSVIVLAAGRGTRFDGTGHKLAQPLGTSSVLLATLAAAIASHLRVVVVTTAPFVVLPEVGSPGGDSLGIGASIAAGVSASPDSRGWLVLPGDMPLVEPATLVAVARALAVHPVAYAQHNGRRGHPVGFAAELYSELTALSGDEGARRLVARYPAFAVERDDPGILIDIDTASDLAAVRGGDAAAILADPRRTAVARG